MHLLPLLSKQEKLIDPMEDTIGQTTLESMPEEFRGESRRKRSHWALTLVFITLLLFGAYWLYTTQYVYMENVASTTLPTVSESTTASQEPSIDDLQAAAANFAIPEYSENF